MLSFSPFGGILFNAILILRLASSKDLKSNETSLKTAETDIVYVQPEARTVVKMIGNTTLTPPSLKVLNQILKNLERFSDQRVKELDSLSTRQSILSVGNASLADQLLSLRNGLSSLKPIKKTFGYKVTVYRSPSTADGKPMVVKEYFDQEEPGNGKEGKQEDLSSANSNSHDPVVPAPSYQHGVYVPQSGHQIIKEKDHGKKSEEHVHASHHHDRGLHKDSAKLLEHEEESHGSKHGGHHRESNEHSHNQGEYGHDKAGASQTGVRERTEIEFFEKEHFLDTEHDKSKSGHENRNGRSESDVRDEHLSQEDHKAQGAHDSHSSHKDHGAARKETAPVLVDNYGESSNYGHRVAPGGHQEDKHAVSGENADREHHSNQDSSKKSGLHGRHHSQQSSEDSSYTKKDKGRTKEGYRERGYKITTEREYFLKDAHHDTGFGKHNNGHQTAHLDKAKHGSEGGERHRDFKKEHATHDSHDVASDKKEGHRQDAEHHQGHEKGDGEYYQQPDYLHGAPSGNLPAVAQKREGPQLSSSKTTKCKTCCRKYGQTTTRPPVRITPRQAKHLSTASGSVIHAVKSRINSSIPVVSNQKKTVENVKKTDDHASPKPLEETRRRNITWPSSIQRLVSEKRKRPKGKIVRHRLPSNTANFHTNSSQDLDSVRPSERNGYRSSYAIVHPPAGGNIDNSVQALTTSALLDDYNREQGLKHSKTETSINRVRTEFPSTSIGPFRTKVSTLAPVTSNNEEDYKYEPTVKPMLKYQFSPMPILSLYGGANSGLHYYEPNSGHSIIKTPVSEVKYLDDTDVQSHAEVKGFTTPPYHRESYSTSRSNIHSNNMHVPETFAGTYGSPIKQDYIPTYRDSPSREKQSFHSPDFLTTSESPDNRGLYKYIISPPREGESYVTTVPYSQPLLKSHPDYKQTGIWYAKKKK